VNAINSDFDKAALKLRIGELSGALATAQITLAEAQPAINAKDQEIAALKKSFALCEELVEYEGYHYRKNSVGKPQGRPFCPRCFQEGRLMMMMNQGMPERGSQCPECERPYPGVLDFPFENRR
jgi:hypothetical protein